MTRKEAANILNISPNDDLATVKQAFRKLAMKYHPDKNQDHDTKSQFITIHEAYTYLCDVAEGKIKESSYQQKGASSNSTNWNRDFNTFSGSSYSQQDFDRRFEEARRKAEEILDKESEQIYHNVLESYQFGWKRTFVKWFAPLAALMGLLLFIDFFLPNSSEVRMDTFVSENITSDGSYQYYNYGKRDIQIDYHLYSYLMSESIIATIYYKPILRDVTSIEILTEQGASYLIEPILQSHRYFPFLHLLFFLPLASLFVEKAKFWFVFFVIYTNLYILPSLFAIMLYRTIFL